MIVGLLTIAAAALGSGGFGWILVRMVLPWARNALWNTGKYLPLRDSHVLMEAQKQSIRPEETLLRLRYADQAKENYKNVGLFALSLTTLFGFGQWRINDAWKDHYNGQVKAEKLQTTAARAERDAQASLVKDKETEITGYKARISEASLQREQQITVSTKAKTTIRQKRIESEKKLAPTEPVNPADLLRIESARSSGDQPDNIQPAKNP